MKAFGWLGIFIAALLISSLAVPIVAQDAQARAWGGGGNGTLTADEIKWLKYMREEEKMARDLYVLMYDTWKLPIFQNIAASEQKHMDSIKKMLDKYGVPDPALSGYGTFDNDEIQALYNVLKARGLISSAEALKVGVEIEMTDINDLNAAIAVTKHTDIINVYTNLLAGSYNHLAAFNLHLA